MRGWAEDLESRRRPAVGHPAASPASARSRRWCGTPRCAGPTVLIIDQLTFIEPPDERAAPHIQIRDITHDLKTLISTGRDKMPCLLAHQINREGVKAADKVGYLEMYHLAEGVRGRAHLRLGLRALPLEGREGDDDRPSSRPWPPVGPTRALPDALEHRTPGSLPLPVVSDLTSPHSPEGS